MSYEDEEDYMLSAWSGECIAYRVEGFHLYTRSGKYLGTMGLKRGTSFRANEIFKEGRYVGEVRKGRLLFDASKDGMKPLMTYRLPRLREMPPRLWCAPEEPWDLPEGCSPFRLPE